MKMLGPFWVMTDHDLDGYGGTWHRAYKVGIRLWSHGLSLHFHVARNREKR